MMMMMTYYHIIQYSTVILLRIIIEIASLHHFFFVSIVVAAVVSIITPGTSVHRPDSMGRVQQSPAAELTTPITVISETLTVCGGGSRLFGSVTEFQLDYG